MTSASAVGDWERVPIGEVTTLRQGLCFNKKTKHLLADSGIPVLRIRDLIDRTEVQYCKEDQTPVKFVASESDIIYTRTGQVGLVFTGRTGVIHNNCFTVTPNEKLTRRFLYWVLRNPLFRRRARALAAGAAQPDLPHSAFKSIEIAYPTPGVQERIADILSGYDDLIENNRRRIRLLEESARLLYKEWFVHLRFPGHEHVKVIDGLREGWTKAPLGEVTSVVMGNSPKSDTYNDVGDGVPLVNGPVEFGDYFAKRVKWTTKPSRVCQANDLIVCVRGSTTGRNVKSDGEYCLGRGVCAISGPEQSFVDQMFKVNLRGLLGLTTGATFPAWSGPTLKSFPVLWPPKALRKLYESYGEPIASQTRCLYENNGRLSAARDLLLPRLMNGEVVV